jgi:hypothetical protein
MLGIDRFGGAAYTPAGGIARRAALPVLRPLRTAILRFLSRGAGSSRGG